MSRPEQLRGDSLRRQTEAAAVWAAARGVEIDDSLRDIGVSAYKGKNRDVGALGLFIRMVVARQPAAVAAVYASVGIEFGSWRGMWGAPAEPTDLGSRRDGRPIFDGDRAWVALRGGGRPSVSYEGGDVSGRRRERGCAEAQ